MGFRLGVRHGDQRDGGRAMRLRSGRKGRYVRGRGGEKRYSKKHKGSATGIVRYGI